MFVRRFLDTCRPNHIHQIARPANGLRHREHLDEGIHNIVEVESRHDPLAAVVDAVLLCADLSRFCVAVEPERVTCFADAASASQQVNADSREDEAEQKVNGQEPQQLREHRLNHLD